MRGLNIWTQVVRVAGLLGVFSLWCPLAHASLDFVRHYDTSDCPQPIPGTGYVNAGSADGTGLMEWTFNVGGVSTPYLFSFKGGQLHVKSATGQTLACKPGLGASLGKNYGAHFIQVSPNQVIAIMQGPINPNEPVSTLQSAPWVWDDALIAVYVGPNPASVQGPNGSTMYTIGQRVATIPLSTLGIFNGVTGIIGDVIAEAGKRPAEVYVRFGENLENGKFHVRVSKTGQILFAPAGVFRLADSPVAPTATYQTLFPPLTPSQAPPSGYSFVPGHNGNGLTMATLQDGVRRLFTTSIADTRVRTYDPNKRMKWVGSVLELNHPEIPGAYSYDHHNTGCCHVDSVVSLRRNNQDWGYFANDTGMIVGTTLAIGGNSVTVRGTSPTAVTLPTQEDAVHYTQQFLTPVTGGQSLSYGRVVNQPAGTATQGLPDGLLLSGQKTYTLNGVLVATMPNGANGAPIGAIGSLLQTNWGSNWTAAGAYSGDKYAVFQISGNAFAQFGPGFYGYGNGAGYGMTYAWSSSPYPINFTTILSTNGQNQYMGNGHGGVGRNGEPTAIARNAQGGFTKRMLVAHSTRSVAEWKDSAEVFSAPLTPKQEQALWADAQHAQAERAIDGSVLDRALMNIPEPPTIFKFGAASPDCAGTKLDADAVLIPGDQLKVTVRNAAPNSVVVFGYGSADFDGTPSNGVTLYLNPSAPFGVDLVTVNAQGIGERTYQRPTVSGAIGGQFFTYNASCPIQTSTAASDLVLLEIP